MKKKKKEKDIKIEWVYEPDPDLEKERYLTNQALSMLISEDDIRNYLNKKTKLGKIKRKNK